jgi:Protein of unknown function (DUF2939)
MTRFALRNFTAILILVVFGWWSIFYVPSTPTWAVLRLKQAIDARDGNRAAQYVDFPKLVQHAGEEMVKQKSAGNPVSALVGQAAIQLLNQPIANALQSVAIKKVNDGDKDVQMPGAAVAGALVLLHRNDDEASTNFTDHKGQTWKIHMTRENGVWKITQVENIQQILEKLQKQKEKQLNLNP